MHKDKIMPGISEYPMNMERELLSRVRMGDRSGARRILNEMLGHVFMRAEGNIDITKARILELVVVISRAAVESGASLEKLLGLNYDFIGELSRINQFDEMCQWVVKMLDTFMDTVYEVSGVHSSRHLLEALSYIRQYYGEALTLERLANHAHVSTFHLSRAFKRELNMTFVEYLTKARMEAARTLLVRTDMPIAEVAGRVGYEDAGYFTKVFKRCEGVTPHNFRKNRLNFG